MWIVDFWQYIGNVIPWMSVETLSKPLLVKVVANKANGSSENEQAVQCAHFNVFICLLWGKHPTRAEKIHDSYSNESVDV